MSAQPLPTKSKYKRLKKHARAVCARLLLAAHSFYCIFKANPTSHPSIFFLLIPVLLLPVEAWLTWRMHKGKEWKW